MSKTQYELVREFHNKFGLEYKGPPRKLSKDEQKFRIKCLREELGEYEEAVEIDDAEGQLDALVDLVYFALGTAHRCGWDFDTAFNRVHYANMQKSVESNRQRRDFHLEITKPVNWIPPDLSSLVVPQRSPVNSEDVQVAHLHGLVLIDGVDSSGKTSLARRIVEMTNGEYIHLTWTKVLGDNMDEYRTGALMYAAALAKEKVVVIERPITSYIVYSNVYRNGEMVDRSVLEHWIELTQDKNVDIMAVPGSRKRWFELYMEMVRSRDELYANHDHELMKAVYDEFKLFIAMDMIVYDMFTMLDPVDIDTWIMNNVIPTLHKKEQ